MYIWDAQLNRTQFCVELNRIDYQRDFAILIVMNQGSDNAKKADLDTLLALIHRHDNR